MSIGSYLMTVGDAVSQLGNALFFNSGNANESISGRSYAMKDQSKFWNCMYHFVNFILYPLAPGIDHCESAFHNDLVRARNLLNKYPTDPTEYKDDGLN